MFNQIRSHILSWRGYLSTKWLLTQPPIIIGGCARSGTTLLSSMLSAHPSIFIIPRETGAFCKRHYGPGEDIPKIDLRLVYREIPFLPPVAKKRWGEKTPKNIHEFDEIRRQLGKVKFVHIVRDGRDVVTSVHPKKPGQYWVPIERWILDVRAGLRQKECEDVFTLKYEDLVLNYELTMRSLLEFLEESWSPRMEHWWEHASVRRQESLFSSIVAHSQECVGKWNKPEHRERVKEFTDNNEAVHLLELLGYGQL